MPASVALVDDAQVVNRGRDVRPEHFRVHSVSMIWGVFNSSQVPRSVFSRDMTKRSLGKSSKKRY